MAQNQSGSRIIQPTASWNRGLSWPSSLGWAYPGHGLPWTWKCSLMHSIVVRDFAEEVNKCCACSLFNCIPDLHSRETRAAVAGKWPASRESRKYCLNSTSSILLKHLFQTTRLIADEIFVEVSAERRERESELAEQPHTVIVIEI